MPQYLLSVHHVEGAETPSTDDMAPVHAAVDAFNTRLRDEGAWVFAGGLQGPETSMTVDATGEVPMVTAGPFIEAVVWLGGFWVIEAADQDAALAWAHAGSKASGERIEVTPFQVGA